MTPSCSSARRGLSRPAPTARYYHDARELARRVTEWSNNLNHATRRFVICSGGGPGIMEAANRGAQDAGGKTIGLNIGLPFEQRPNPFITPELSFEFHYFFMRKFWFAYLAKALVVFPGRIRHPGRAHRNPDPGADPEARKENGGGAVRHVRSGRRSSTSRRWCATE